jgi:hypothetical protein
MSGTKEGKLSKRNRMIIKKEIWIRGRKDPSRLSSRIAHKKVSKGSWLKMIKNDRFPGEEANTTSHKVLVM